MLEFVYSSFPHFIFKIPLILYLFLALSSQNFNILYGGEIHKNTKTMPPPFNLHIIFTGEENGYLEPCGCSEGRIGGLPKRGALINQLLRENAGNYVLVSSGDLSKDVGRQDEIKMETLLTALEQMGYAAHNLGEKDISMGLELLSNLSQISNVSFISSNVNIEGLIISPYVIKEIQTEGEAFKIGILGILSPSLVDDGYAKILDPVVSLTPLLSELKGKTDFLILLSHSEIDDSLELAKIFPELDVIVSGHGIDEPDFYIKKVGNTYVVPVGEKGKYLGMITFPLEYTLNGQSLHAIRADKTQRKQATALYEEQEDYGILDYNSQSAKKNEPFIEITPLDERHKDSPEMKELLKVYQQRLKDEELVKKMFKSNPPSGLAFIGNDDCATCHNKIFKHWEETHHASAYETLIKAEHEYDPECLTCHTIGIHYFTGFETIETTPKMKNVGCENCHGPGSSHKVLQSKDYGKTDEENCITCRNYEHSPKFQFNKYWQKIKHPPDGMNRRSYN